METQRKTTVLVVGFDAYPHENDWRLTRNGLRMVIPSKNGGERGILFQAKKSTCPSIEGLPAGSKARPFLFLTGVP